MAKFAYRLQNILDIKINLETQAKTAYGQAQIKLNEEEAKLEELKMRKAEYEQAYRDSASGNLNFGAMTRFSQAVETMQQYIKRQQVAIHVAQKNLDVARQRLNLAMQERKTHEKLKEKEFEAFLQELNDQEKKEIDELVSFRFNDKEGDGNG